MARLAACRDIQMALGNYRAMQDRHVREGRADADRVALGFLLLASDQLRELIAAESLAQARTAQTAGTVPADQTIPGEGTS
jgi:hypothetical protein